MRGACAYTRGLRPTRQQHQLTFARAQQLNASGNNIATFKVLPTLPQLRELYLNDNDLSSIPKSFNKRFPVLDVLELMQNDLTVEEP